MCCHRWKILSYTTFVPTSAIKINLEPNGFGEADEGLTPGESYDEVATTLMALAEECRDACVEMRHTPYIGENGTWLLYDINSKSYVDSGVYAKGIDGKDGYTPQKGVDYFDGKDGYTPQKGVDYFDGKDGQPFRYEDFTKEQLASLKGDKGDKGDQGERGTDGKTGADGYTPIRGIDYWSEEDKEEILKDSKHIFVVSVETGMLVYPTYTEYTIDSPSATYEEIKTAYEEGKKIILMCNHGDETFISAYWLSLCNVYIDDESPEDSYFCFSAIDLENLNSVYSAKCTSSNEWSFERTSMASASGVANSYQKKLSAEQVSDINDIDNIRNTAMGADATASVAMTTAGSAYDRTVELEDSKKDKVDITYDLTNSQVAFDMLNMDNSELRCKVALTDLGITFANEEYPHAYLSGLSFYSGDAPTHVIYAGGGIINWVGVDCTTSEGSSIFQPSANTHYDIVFYYNGTQMIGSVNGYVPANRN